MRENIRVAVIGVGYLGQHHARIYSELENVSLVGVVDINKDRANEVAKKIGCHPFYDFHEIMNKVDAVSIAVPTVIHHKTALEFIRKNKDVLLEKPVASTVPEADDLINESDKRELVLQIGHLERFNSAVRSLEKIIHMPKFIESHRIGPFAERGIDVDVILDLMIHDIDILLSIVKSELIEVRGVGVSVISPMIDIANARLEFKNGCVANITASRVSREKMRKIRIFQPEAYISLDYQKQELLHYKRVYNKDNGNKPDVVLDTIEIEKREPLKVELSEFIDSVRKRNRPVVSGVEGRNALMVALEIIKDISKRGLSVSGGSI